MSSMKERKKEEALIQCVHVSISQFLSFRISTDLYLLMHY
jgi:hypothetical protein